MKGLCPLVAEQSRAGRTVQLGPVEIRPSDCERWGQPRANKAEIIIISIIILIITYINNTKIYNSYNRNYARLIYAGKSNSKLHLANYCSDSKFTR